MVALLQEREVGWLSGALLPPLVRVASVPSPDRQLVLPPSFSGLRRVALPPLSSWPLRLLESPPLLAVSALPQRCVL